MLYEFARRALAVVVRTKMDADDVFEALYPLLLQSGAPEYIRTDNGPGFAAEPLPHWLRSVGIKPTRICPGSPLENGYKEWFAGTRRREVLNAAWVTTTEQVQIVINYWLRLYNQTRLHRALKTRPPVPETLLEKPPISGPETGARHPGYGELWPLAQCNHFGQGFFQMVEVAWLG